MQVQWRLEIIYQAFNCKNLKLTIKMQKKSKFLIQVLWEDAEKEGVAGGARKGTHWREAL